MSSSPQQKLLNKAQVAWKNAQAKHTGFRVGAALLAKSGKIYTGVNVESDIPSLSICADRAALVSALSQGEKEFLALALVTETKKATPCGACRQMLFEFCGGNLKILSCNTQGTHQEEILLKKLLPKPYLMTR